MWSSYAIPKTSFITWLAVHDKLATKERLVRVHILSDNVCALCGCIVESKQHFLFIYPILRDIF